MAELLVTMGILGVIALIALPVLQDAQPNKELVMLKKVYYNTSRIVSELINDDYLYPESDEENKQGFGNTISREYLGYTFKDEKKFCALFASKLNLKDGSNPVDVCKGRKSLDAGGSFTTTDGVIWNIPDVLFGVPDYVQIFVDVNGTGGDNCAPASQPNPYWNADDMKACGAGKKPDRFYVTVYRNGSLNIPSELGRLYVTSSNTNKSFTQFIKEHPTAK